MLFLPFTFATFAESRPSSTPADRPHDDPRFAALREQMVSRQLAGRDIVSTAVLQIMGTTPRHKFVPPAGRDYAYEDYPLPIGYEQTISQPYIVALMTQQLAPKPGDKVLEIGTGSGYQAAVLAGLAKEVYSIEIVKPLADEAAQRLKALGYANVHVRAGDGYKGWPEVAPFDGIVVTAAPGHIPQPLKDQLKVGGRLVIPVGESYQKLLVITRTEKGFVEESTLDVRFVPMTGEAAKK